MATLSTQPIGQSGTTPAYTAASGGGDAYTPGEHTFLHVKNGGGGSINVTLTPLVSVDGLALAALVVAVAAGTERMIKPVNAEAFKDPATGLAAIAYSGVTTVTVGAFRA